MATVDKPNVTLPLAASYNVRGQDGFANTFTNSLDQRKVNTIYRLGVNPITGKQTLYLCRRPGVTIKGASYGTTGQIAYLAAIGTAAASLGNDVWVFSKNGDDVRASSSAATTVIATAAGYMPAFWDKTAVSGVDNIVLQTRKATLEQRVFYGTAIGTWTEITDGDFTGLSLRGKMEFIDGYALTLDSMNRIYNSDINSLANWTAGSFITKQIRQDIPFGLARFGQQILAFGEQTVEVFVNTGAGTAGSPLSTVKELAQEVGMDAAINTTGNTHYYAILGPHMYFIGREGNSLFSKGVFAYNGSRFEKVSTLFIDSILQSTNYYSINNVGFEGQEAIAIALDDTLQTTQRWLMFFPKFNEWFEWNSTVFSPVNNGTYHIGLGANQHRIYNIGTGFSGSQWQDDTTNLTVTHQFQWPKEDNSLARMPMFSVVGDTASGASSLGVSFSDDDGATWSTVRNIDMTSVDKVLYRCGAFRQRLVRLTHTANLDLRLRLAAARVE